MNFVMLFVVILATWRVSSLLANEDGPFYVFKRLRRLVAVIENRVRLVHEFHLYEGLNCEWCNSVWVGIVFSVIWSPTGSPFFDYIALPLALSAGAIAFKFVIQGLEQWHKSMVQLNEVEDDHSPAPLHA